jgi:hypothetical protein
VICTDEGGIGRRNKYLGRVPAAAVKAFVQILANSWLSYTKSTMSGDGDSLITLDDPKCPEFEPGATAAYLVVC